jgi:CRP/FNR family transcriptional regulator, cyclic AMP receptor protein
MRLNLAWSASDAQALSLGPHRPHEPSLSLPERAALNAGPWFAALPMVLRHDIMRSCEVRALRSGAAVYGAETPGLCGIAAGAVGIRLHSAGARILDYAPAGTWLLDPSALAGGPPLLALEAHRRATVVRLPCDVLCEVLRRHPGAAAALQALGYAAVRRVTPILEDLAGLPLRRKVARCVLRLCDSFGRAQPDGTRIALALSQDEIAQMLRASRQHVNYELKSLEAAGALRIAKELVVCERAALELAAG